MFPSTMDCNADFNPPAIFGILGEGLVAGGGESREVRPDSASGRGDCADPAASIEAGGMGTRETWLGPASGGSD